MNVFRSTLAVASIALVGLAACGDDSKSPAPAGSQVGVNSTEVMVDNTTAMVDNTTAMVDTSTTGG